MASGADVSYHTTAEPDTLPPDLAVQRLLSNRYTAAEREATRLRFAPGAKVLVRDDDGVWTKGEVLETWILTRSGIDDDEDLWCAYRVNVRRKSTPVARDHDDFIRRFVTTVDQVSLADQNVNRLAEEHLDAEEAHEADGGGASAAADAPAIAPTFSPGDFVWANIDGHDPDEGVFVPRPMVVLDTPDEGDTYNLAYAFDPASPALTRTEGNTMLEGFEAMERAFPAFSAVLVKTPELTLRVNRSFEDLRTRDDARFADCLATNLRAFYADTEKEVDVARMSTAGVPAEFHRLGRQMSRMSSYSKCSEGCCAMHFLRKPPHPVVTLNSATGLLEERQVPAWEWHTALNSDDPHASEPDAIYEQQLSARWTDWDEAEVPPNLKQVRLRAEMLSKNAVMRAESKRQRVFKLTVLRARKAARAAAAYAGTHATNAGGAVMRHIEAHCAAARAAARAAANAADAAAFEVSAELKRIAFFARQAAERDAAAERARAARALIASRKQETAGPTEEDRAAAVRALELQRSKALARSEELAAKQAAAVERGRARKTARVLKQVLAKALLASRGGAEAAERFACAARFSAETEQRRTAAAATAAAAEAERLAAARAARAEEKQRRHTRRQIETVKRVLRGVSSAAKRCAAAAAAAAASAASVADAVAHEALRLEAARHVSVAAADDGVAEECQICFMELPLLTMECGHELCPPCLQKWTAMTIKSNRSKTSCPFCRVAIKKKPPGVGHQTSAWQQQSTAPETDYVIPRDVQIAGEAIARAHRAALQSGREAQPSVVAASAPSSAPPGLAAAAPPGLTAGAAEFAPPGLTAGAAEFAPSGSVFRASSSETAHTASRGLRASSSFFMPTPSVSILPGRPPAGASAAAAGTTARASNGGYAAGHLYAGAPHSVPPGFLQSATFFTPVVAPSAGEAFIHPNAGCASAFDGSACAPPPERRCLWWW